jgi:hypothetical protein
MLLLIYIDLKRKDSDEFNFVLNNELFTKDLSLLLDIWVFANIFS